MAIISDQSRKITALQKMCGVLSRRPIDDIALVAMVSALRSVSADDVERAVEWSIRNEVTLPTPSQILEKIQNGQYHSIERVPVVLTDDERIASYWKEDMEDCGISNQEKYKAHIERWEKENPGDSYYETIVKRRY